MTDEQQLSPELEELRAAYRKITPPSGLAGRIVADARDASQATTWSWVPVAATAAGVAVVVLLVMTRPVDDQPGGGLDLWLQSPPMSALTEDVPTRPPVDIPSLADVSAVPVTLATPRAELPTQIDSGPQSAVPINPLEQPTEDSQHERTLTTRFYS